MPATAVPLVSVSRTKSEIRAVNNIVVLVIFAIVAVIILVQLYSVLGRKVGFRVEDKVLAKTGDDVDGKLQLERPAEPPKFPNLDVLKARDANFNEINFFEKARETYEQVVLAFHRGELDAVKDRLTETVYGSFAKAVEAREGTPVTTRLSFVETPKADIDVIDFKDDVAQIRVRFLSELLYEAEATEADAKPEKTYRRTAEYWTFQKGMKSPANPWLLARVEAAKA